MHRSMKQSSGLFRLDRSNPFFVYRKKTAPPDGDDGFFEDCQKVLFSEEICILIVCVLSKFNGKRSVLENGFPRRPTASSE